VVPRKSGHVFCHPCVEVTRYQEGATSLLRGMILKSDNKEKVSGSRERLCLLDEFG
jgi:hypothetical protein